MKPPLGTGFDGVNLKRKSVVAATFVESTSREASVSWPA